MLNHKDLGALIAAVAWYGATGVDYQRGGHSGRFLGCLSDRLKDADRELFGTPWPEEECDYD